MFDSFLGFMVVVGAVWLTIGLVLSVVMGRRGHSSFSWLILGAVFGPLAVVLAISSSRHGEALEPRLAAPARVSAGPGFVDVLVGFDGSPESLAAIEGAARLFGDRLGRFAVTTVVPFDGGAEQERLARAGLQLLAGPGGPANGLVTEFEILHGRPAEALRAYATKEGFELIAVGARGAGVSKRLLGSAASELAGGGEVPVLVVGQR